MKILKSSRFWNTFISIILIILLAILLWQLYSLNVLPQNIQLPIVIILILAVFVVILVNIEFRYKPKIQIICLILSLLLAIAYGFGAYYLYRTDGTLSAITAIRNTNDNNISVIVMNDSDIHALEDLSGKKLSPEKYRQGRDRKSTGADSERNACGIRTD